MLRPMQITAGQLERHPERWLDDMLDAGYTARTPEGVRPKPCRVQTCAEQSRGKVLMTSYRLRTSVGVLVR